MFKHNSYFLDGITTRFAIENTTGAVQAAAKYNVSRYNSAIALTALKSHPDVYNLLAETPIPVAVAYYDDLDHSAYPIAPLVGYAEPRADGVAQLNIVFSEYCLADEIMALAKHELIHAEDIASGRLVFDPATDIVKWEGVEYKNFTLPSCIGSSLEDAIKYIINVAKYASQPWEAKANAHMWGLVAYDFDKLIEQYGTVWNKDWNEDAIMEVMVRREGANLYNAVSALYTH